MKMLQRRYAYEAMSRGDHWRLNYVCFGRFEVSKSRAGFGRLISTAGLAQLATAPASPIWNPNLLLQLALISAPNFAMSLDENGECSLWPAATGHEAHQSKHRYWHASSA